MALANNIAQHRKRRGWSQEELAHRLSVSRQSVSKWESGQSTPDLSRVVELTQLFNTTTDELLGNVTANEPLVENGFTMDMPLATQYMHYKVASSVESTRGAVLCVGSPIVLFITLTMASLGVLGMSSSVAVSIGVVALLLCIVVAVRHFIVAANTESPIPRVAHSGFNVDASCRQDIQAKQKEYLPHYQRQISLGVAFFILSPVPVILIAVFSGQQAMILLALPILLILINLGLVRVIPASTRMEAYRFLLAGGDLDAGKSESTKRAEKLGAFYWPLLVAVYLGWSLTTMNWGVTWAMFPAGAALFVAIVGLSKLLQKP